MQNSGIDARIGQQFGWIAGSDIGCGITYLTAHLLAADYLSIQRVRSAEEFGCLLKFVVEYIGAYGGRTDLVFLHLLP